MKQIDLGVVHIATYRSKYGLCSGDERASLLDPDDEVIIKPSVKVYTFKIDYPLTNPYIVKVGFPFGCTRRAMVDYIVGTYRGIYKEEKRTTKKPIRNIPGMLNRDTTDGKYGVCGHHIGDLVLHTLYIKGKTITVGVDS